MTITCPACRKGNDPAGDTCSRCGCDLSALRAVAHAAHIEAQAAGEALRRGQWTLALECAERSWSLRHSTLAAQLTFLSAAALGKSEEAIHWHRCAMQAGDDQASPPPNGLS